MAKREVGRLAAIGLQKKKPGMHADGGGLWLQVTDSGARSWVFRFTLRGRSREMGLGSLSTVNLAEAREAARAGRQQLREGIDPIEARQARRDAVATAAIPRTVFAECAASFITANAPEWKNAKHADQWRNTLATYVYPKLGKRPVADIGTDDVVAVLEPIWTTKTETATRVRQRIEAVLDYATVRRLRSGENPARWGGHLDMLLPKPAKVRKVEHHPALHYSDAAEFMAKLRAQAGVGARALEFAILTAARTGEVIGATWGEVDLDGKVWAVPGERMKAGREHKVPMCTRAVDILKGVAGDRTGWLFPGQGGKKPLSNMSLAAVLKRMGRADITAHGFRSTFRDWASETTNYPHEVVEMALAHAIKDKTEKAYRRGDLFAKRAQLMAAWSAYCARDPNQTTKVVPMRREA